MFVARTTGVNVDKDSSAQVATPATAIDDGREDHLRSSRARRGTSAYLIKHCGRVRVCVFLALSNPIT